MELVFRSLTHDEVECRVGSVCVSGYTVLLYKDARVDMKLLDEVVGPCSWQRRHVLIGDKLFCAVDVWDESKGQWVTKMDLGTESNTEAEKGQSSDSFKRACTNWGIGRELYTAGHIFIPVDKSEISSFGGNSGRTSYKLNKAPRLNVSGLTVEEGKIVGITITDPRGTVLYSRTAAVRQHDDVRIDNNVTIIGQAVTKKTGVPVDTEKLNRFLLDAYKGSIPSSDQVMEKIVQNISSREEILQKLKK